MRQNLGHTRTENYSRAYFVSTCFTADDEIKGFNLRPKQLSSFAEVCSLIIATRVRNVFLLMCKAKYMKDFDQNSCTNLCRKYKILSTFTIAKFYTLAYLFSLQYGNFFKQEQEIK